jgi:hypothetical protein
MRRAPSARCVELVGETIRRGDSEASLELQAAAVGPDHLALEFGDRVQGS